MQRECTVRGVGYVAQPEVVKYTCEGCAGDATFEDGVSVCGELPTGCDRDRLIWVKEIEDGKV